MGWTTLTGVGGLVMHDGKLLMVKQRRPYGVHWELPAGYYEAGETFEEAAAREVLEETGVTVTVEELVCTLLWEREHDCRRYLLAYFRATPIYPVVTPTPQVEEGIEAAGFVDPDELPPIEIHPLEAPILDRWWRAGQTGFHVNTRVIVGSDGAQSYEVRPSAP